jgi:LuxR family quorum-sensing system transcriptional regulator CciR
MLRLEVAEQFIAKARSSQTHSDLFNLMEASVREIGFTYFALVHYADLRQASPHVVRIENYPREGAE